MKTIGVRELRQHASRYLRDVERGETIEITDRGRPMARLVPIARSEAPLEALIAAGRLTKGAHEVLDSAPLEPVPGVPLPSETLRDARADER